VLQAALCLKRGLERIACRVERRAERIAGDLKDVSVVHLDRLMQNGMMPREEGGQFGRELLRQRGAALDVREEESDGAGEFSPRFLSAYATACSNVSMGLPHTASGIVRQSADHRRNDHKRIVQLATSER
jgi:hypothetical protein